MSFSLKRPVLICDKSFLQGLSNAAADALHHYFTINVTPILLLEVLGDLEKSTKRGGASYVSGLARKIRFENAHANVPWKELVRLEILEEFGIPMKRGPLFFGEYRVIPDDGQIIFESSPSPEEEELFRWQDAAFVPSDTQFSRVWRAASQHDKDLLVSIRRNANLPKVGGSLAEMAEACKQNPLSDSMPLLLALSAEERIALSHRTKELPARVTLPYSAFCTSVWLVFFAAIRDHLIGTDKNHLRDCEYMMYLPFCHVFVTSDKAQHAMAEAFAERDQTVVRGDDLRADLVRLSDRLRSDRDSAEASIRHSEIPPPSLPSDSLLAQLWDRYGEPEWRKLYKPPSPIRQPSARSRRAVEAALLRRLSSSRPMYWGFLDEGKCTAAIRKSKLRTSDPCPCGSGKDFLSCCRPKNNGLLRFEPIPGRRPWDSPEAPAP